MIEGYTDLQLMSQIAEKQANALEQLYDRYEKTIYSFAYRIVSDVTVAEEIVQELFIRVWNYAERFDASHGKPSSWMFTLTRNIAIDILRTKQNRTGQQAARQQQNDVPDSNKADDEQPASNWAGGQVKQALQFLSEDQKSIVEWIYYQGFTQQEVSDQFAIPLGTVKSRVRLAVKQLKLRLDKVVKRGDAHE